VQVILDTNFWYIPHKFHIDVLTQITQLLGPCSLVIFRGTIHELSKATVDKIHAQFALKYIEALQHKNAITIIEGSTELVDDQIVEYATTHKTVIVATQDKQLKRRLKTLGIRILIFRKKSYITFEGD
jgi:rRNA-processing protein FCF1